MKDNPTKATAIPPQYLYLYNEAKAGNIKAYFARSEKSEAKIKFCTQGKPTYVGFPWAEALYDCAEYVPGGVKKLYRMGCGYQYQPTSTNP